MSLLKPPLLLLSALSYHVSICTPSSPDSGDKLMGTSLRERMWAYAVIPCSIFAKTVTWGAALAESLVVVRSVWGVPGSSDALSAVLDTLGPPEASQLTFPFIGGALLVIASGVIRVECFRALGPLFTVQQVIRKDHKLITTGPYAVVRHPGYISLLMGILGTSIVYGSPGSWLRVSGMLGVPWVRAAAIAWGVLMLASVVTLFRRSTEEDQFLKERFGKEWESWAKRVKHKLVPFIY